MVIDDWYERRGIPEQLACRMDPAPACPAAEAPDPAAKTPGERNRSGADVWRACREIWSGSGASSPVLQPGRA